MFMESLMWFLIIGIIEYYNYVETNKNLFS